MAFKDYLTRSLLISELKELKIDNDSILSEEDRNILYKIIDKIKKLFSLNVRELFRLSDGGGEVEEEIIIYDLYKDVLEEAVNGITAKTVQQGNYFKIVRMTKATPPATYNGFIIERLGIDDEEIAMKWSSGPPSNIRWFKDIDDAARELDQMERQILTKNIPIVKPKLSLRKLPKRVRPPKINVRKIASVMAAHMGDYDASKTISDMNDTELQQAAEVGKQSTSSSWDVFKTVALAYLALTALVSGASGLAALIIGYLAVKGIDLMRRQDPNSGIHQKKLRLSTKSNVQPKDTADTADTAAERFKQFKQSK